MLPGTCGQQAGAQTPACSLQRTAREPAASPGRSPNPPTPQTTQALLTGLKLAGRLDASKAGQRLWAAWQQLLGLAGLAGVPQVLWATFSPGSASLAPCAVTLAAACAAAAAEAAGRLPAAARGLWAAASAWTATALFCLQPISQLVQNLRDPASLEGLSLTTILLAAAGNALMVPRALWTRDWVWLTGSLWGSLFFGWAQLLRCARLPPAGRRCPPGAGEAGRGGRGPLRLCCWGAAHWRSTGGHAARVP